MTPHCWTLTLADGAERYVSATSEAEALDFGGVHAERTFPWLSDAFEDIDPDTAEDGARGNPNGPSAGSHPRTAEVQAWLATYAGRNRFVLDVRAKQQAHVSGSKQVRKRPRLSYKQVDALAKAKDREAEWQAEREKARLGTGMDLRSALPPGTTRAAALNEHGTLSFVRLDNVTSGKWAGWVFAKGIVGGEEERLGAQRPGEADYAGTWSTVIRNVLADVVAAVERYGTELGECGVCGRQLTNEESRQGGIGPVCRARLDTRETIVPDTEQADSSEGELR